MTKRTEAYAECSPPVHEKRFLHSHKIGIEDAHFPSGTIFQISLVVLYIRRMRRVRKKDIGSGRSARCYLSVSYSGRRHVAFCSILVLHFSARKFRKIE